MSGGRLFGNNRWHMSDAFTKPGKYTKGQIERAGKAIAAGRGLAADNKIVQEWRDCHAYVLNTFQNTLRRWIRAEPYVLVQRLKRLNTVKNKLLTGRAKDLASGLVVPCAAQARPTTGHDGPPAEDGGPRPLFQRRVPA